MQSVTSWNELVIQVEGVQLQVVRLSQSQADILAVVTAIFSTIVLIVVGGQFLAGLRLRKDQVEKLEAGIAEVLDASKQALKEDTDALAVTIDSRLSAVEEKIEETVNAKTAVLKADVARVMYLHAEREELHEKSALWALSAATGFGGSNLAKTYLRNATDAFKKITKAEVHKLQSDLGSMQADLDKMRSEHPLEVELIEEIIKDKVRGGYQSDPGGGGTGKKGEQDVV